MNTFLLTVGAMLFTFGPIKAEEAALSLPDLTPHSAYILIGQVWKHLPEFDAVRIQTFTVLKAKEPPDFVLWNLRIENVATFPKVGEQAVFFLKDVHFKDAMMWGTLVTPQSFAVFHHSFSIPPKWNIRKAETSVR